MNPKRYTKKPVTIEALELTFDSFHQALDWIGLENIDAFDINQCEIDIATLEGTMTAKPSDFIIKGVKGEFYPCKPEIFHLSYSEATS